MDVSSAELPALIKAIRSCLQLSQESLSRLIGASLVSVSRWEAGTGLPSPDQLKRILDLYQHAEGHRGRKRTSAPLFASQGVRRATARLPLFDEEVPKPTLSPDPLPPIVRRLREASDTALSELLARHRQSVSIASSPPPAGMSAGKNTYTYDAHTYHTKVPPQGIAELLRHYLPNGGLVMDPFAGSGMTGVAARILGYDCVLNELSPAACFIANRFVSNIDPRVFASGVQTVLDELREIRARLYTTACRECGRRTEILYTVWSYNVSCPHCSASFLLWNHCRQYGSRVREHKILTEFPCPDCHITLHKSRLKRTFAEPVQLGYVCCGSRQQEVVHPLNGEDLQLLYALEVSSPLADGFYPTTLLPDGVNLSQPKRHGIDRIDRFYTPRNLAAMSHLWRTVHRVESTELAAYLAFVVTSLYQRVTRLSEFRFWGGSGNTARFNVPFIFNEANVFVTFERKARSIQDHLETTAAEYRGQVAVIQGSATNLSDLPNESIDLIFTDPPFGANINYSEMNILWEAWLGEFTDAKDEAIINRHQQKDIEQYRALMTSSLEECYRILRPGHWLLLMFMNSSSKVWASLRQAILDAGFQIRQVDIFDKQHGTFKHFVSENTAGYDLVLHCWKPLTTSTRVRTNIIDLDVSDAVLSFIQQKTIQSYKTVYLHVGREPEIDMRKLYSEWIAESIRLGNSIVDFADFRRLVDNWLKQTNSGSWTLS